jgi:hypothetical protein
MTNKTKISLGAASVFFLAIAGSAAAAQQQTCATPEAQMVREMVQTGNQQDPAIQAKLASLPALEKVEAQICARQNLTPDQVAAVVAQKQAMAGFIPSPKADPLPSVTLGVQDPVSPTFLGQDLMVGTNTWTGYVNGKFVVVTGTAEKADPSQGVLFVMNDFTPVGAQAISAPTATGPLKIVSEANGVLTLQSVAGSYEAYGPMTNTRSEVTTSGGTTYKFDLASRTFK